MIDIRSDSARECDGVVPGAVHVPRTVLEWRLDPSSEWRNPHVAPDGPLVLLCDHGWSSSLAAHVLVQLGFAEVADVIGGFEAWSKAGLPVGEAVRYRDSGELPGIGPPDECAPENRLGELQRSRWEQALRERPTRYGAEPSEPGRAALDRFVEAGARDLLELGGGQGRDSLLFARAGLRVTVCDFAPAAVETITSKAQAAGLAGRVAAVELDVREPLPFADSSFDCCYSHMLFCMALDERELRGLAREVLRILRPGGLCTYTARTIDDPDYGQGVHHGEALYELDGFAVHFFDRALVERLARGYRLVELERFEEGELPRRLCRVTMRKP